MPTRSLMQGQVRIHHVQESRHLPSILPSVYYLWSLFLHMYLNLKNMHKKAYPDELLLLVVLLLSDEYSDEVCLAHFELGSKSLSLSPSSEGESFIAERARSSSTTYSGTHTFLIPPWWSFCFSFCCDPLWPTMGFTEGSCSIPPACWLLTLDFISKLCNSLLFWRSLRGIEVYNVPTLPSSLLPFKVEVSLTCPRRLWISLYSFSISALHIPLGILNWHSRGGGATPLCLLFLPLLPPHGGLSWEIESLDLFNHINKEWKDQVT